MAGNLRDHIELDGEPFALAAAFAEGTDTPETAGETFHNDDLVAAMNTWHLGAGYSQTAIPGTYAYAVNGDGRTPRVFLPGPRVNTVTLSSANAEARWAVEQGGDLYVGGGRRAYRIAGGSPASTSLSDVQDLGANVTGWSAQPFLGNAYVGTRDSSNDPSDLWKVGAGGSSWTDAGAGVKYAALETAQYNSTTGYRLFGTDGKNTFKTAAADPTSSANWGTAGSIGDSSGGTLINRLTAAPVNGHVYFHTDRGLYDWDGATNASFNLTPHLKTRRDAENGVGGHAGNGYVYHGTKHGLVRYQATGQDAGRIDDVSFGFGLPNETPIRGQVTATAQDGGWVAQAIYNGTDTYVCWGRQLQAGEGSLGPSPMLWHGGVVTLSGVKCYLLHISGLTDPPRLWIGAGNNVAYCLLPRTGSPLQDADYRYATSYTAYIAALDWGLPATRKNFLRLDCEGDNLGVGASVQWSANVDGTGWSVVGTANTSPQSALLPGTELIGRRIAWKADGTNTTTAGANLRGLLFRAAERVTVRDARTYQVLLAPLGRDQLGLVRHRDPYDALERLRRLCQQGQVTLRDEGGQSYTVLVKPPIRRKVVRLRAAGEPGDGRSTLVASVDVTVLKRLGTTFRWNDGTKFNGGKVWA